MPPVSDLQIGRCGELLVQSRLLRHGIESSCMTLDYGIDLIALPMKRDNKITSVFRDGAKMIQVKTTAKPYERGKQKYYWWWFPQQSPADLIAFVVVDKTPERIWLFDYAELRKQIHGNYFPLHTDESSEKHWTMENFKSHLLDDLEDKLSPPALPALPSK